MYSDIFAFLDVLNNPPNDLKELLKGGKYIFGWKGYGTPELEMKFLHKIFRHIQNKHPEFESFSWLQSNCYNDNYYHIELSSFTINDTLYVNSDITFYFDYDVNEDVYSSIYFDSIDHLDPEEIAYAKENKLPYDEDGLDKQYWDTYREFKNKKYQHLETPSLKMLSLLKLLEINFSMYYFLYTFGNGVEIKFTKEGVTVKKLDENEIEGSPLGTGMKMD